MPIVALGVLSVFADIATLLGCSYNVISTVKSSSNSDNSANDDLTKFIHSFIGLHGPTKTWKAIHLKYHPLSSAFNRVNRYMSNEAGQAKRLEDLNGNALKSIMDDEPIYNAIYKLEEQLAIEIGDLKSANDQCTAEKQHLDAITRYDGSLALDIKKIIDARSNIISTHNRVCAFLGSLRNVINNGDWGNDELKLVMDNRFIYRIGINDVIMTTDTAVMTLLEIYMKLSTDAAIYLRGHSHPSEM